MFWQWPLVGTGLHSLLTLSLKKKEISQPYYRLPYFSNYPACPNFAGTTAFTFISAENSVIMSSAIVTISLDPMKMELR
jgi:hypothetical protein